MTEPLIPLPPADAPVPPRASVARSLLAGMVLGGVFGALLVVFVLDPIIEELRPALRGLSKGTLIGGGIAGGFLAILMHELGHVVGGVSQGFRFLFLVVGPLKVERDAETARLRVTLNRNLEMAGGIAACLPEGEHDLVRRTKWMVAAGPVASLLTAAFLIPIGTALPPSGWSALVAFTGLISLGLAVATAVPARNGSFVTDGKRFLQLSADGPQAVRDAAQLLLIVKDRAGTPIDSIDAALVREAIEPPDGSIFEVVGRATAAAWLVTKGRVAEARLHLARAAVLADGMPFHLGAAVALERGFLAAMFDGDAAGARALTAPHAKAWPILPEHERSRFDAAVALAEGRLDEARAHAVRGVARIEAMRVPRTGSTRWTLDRLREIEQRIDLADR